MSILRGFTYGLGWLFAKAFGFFLIVFLFIAVGAIAQCDSTETASNSARGGSLPPHQSKPSHKPKE